jgi:hypothetical protein
MTDEPTEPHHHHTVSERLDAAHAAAEEVVAEESGQLGGALNALAVPFEQAVAAARAAINPDGLAEHEVAKAGDADDAEDEAAGHGGTDEEQRGH